MADLATLDKLTEYIAQNSTVAATPAPRESAPSVSSVPSVVSAPQTKRFGPYKPIEKPPACAHRAAKSAPRRALPPATRARYAGSKRRTQERTARTSPTRAPPGAFTASARRWFSPSSSSARPARASGSRRQRVGRHVDGLRHEPARPFAGIHHARAHRATASAASKSGHRRRSPARSRGSCASSRAWSARRFATPAPRPSMAAIRIARTVTGLCASRLPAASTASTTRCSCAPRSSMASCVRCPWRPAFPSTS